jgi:hypothetical protein
MMGHCRYQAFSMAVFMPFVTTSLQATQYEFMPANILDFSNTIHFLSNDPAGFVLCCDLLSTIRYFLWYTGKL